MLVQHKFSVRKGVCWILQSL